MTPTLDSPKCDALLCALNGWRVDDVLEGEEYGRMARIRLTAIGRAGIIAQSDHANEPGKGAALF